MKRGNKLLFLSLLAISLISSACHGGPYGSTPQCKDGGDNDLDDYFDYPQDPGCYSSNDNAEDPRGNDRDSGCCEVIAGNGTSCLENTRLNVCDDYSNYFFYNDQTCVDVQCGVTTTTLPNNCLDSDNGIEPNTYGYITFTVNGTTREDWCVGNHVREQYCIGSWPAWTSYLCPNGCLNGACTSGSNTTTTTVTGFSCSDSDDIYGANQIFVAGNVSFFSYGSGPYTVYDQCTTNITHATFLKERSCYQQSPRWLGTNCTKGCQSIGSSGRCIP